MIHSLNQPADTNLTQNEIGPNDVLLGRGGATNNHSGNTRFREIVRAKQLQYLAKKKKEKRAVSEQVVDIVHQNGGRFLKRDDASDCWMEVPRSKAVTKASQALREGLDVKHKRVRESKASADSSSGSGAQRSKRQKVVTGPVAKSSPALVSLSGEVSAVPELLQEEQPAAAAAAKHFYVPGNVTEV